MTKQRLGLFLGTFTHDLFNNSRITLPSRFRVELPGNQIVIVQAEEGSLLCLSGESFLKNSQAYLEAPMFEKTARQPRRNVFQNAVTVEIDKVGRFVIPETLRNWAGIKDKAVLVGLGDAFEIWGEDKFNLVSAQNKGQQ
jgi:MraZ protein